MAFSANLFLRLASVLCRIRRLKLAVLSSSWQNKQRLVLRWANLRWELQRFLRLPRTLRWILPLLPTSIRRFMEGLV
jgi:hypothetical protein